MIFRARGSNFAIVDEAGGHRGGFAHPDANLLSAWLDDDLGRRQRRNLVAHLADCHACRQLVAHANAARGMAPSFASATSLEEAEAPVRDFSLSLPAERGWMHAWRWAVPISALAILAILAVSPGRSDSSYLSSFIAGGAPPRAMPANSAVVRPAPRLRHAVRAAARVAPPRLRSHAHIAPPANVEPIVAQAVAGDATAPLPAAGASAPAAAARQLNSPSDFTPSQQGFLDQPRSGASSPVALMTSPVPEANVAAILMSRSIMPGADETAARPAEAIDFISTGAGSQSAASAFASAALLVSSRRAALSLATVGAGVGTGVGYVRVLGTAVRAARRTIAAAYPQTSEPNPVAWKISDRGELIHSVGAGFWTPAPIDATGKLSAVSVQDSQIWTGGSTTQLFVSRDNGATFQTVSLEGAQAHPARITAIHFADTQNGIITAADGRYWTTLDGGQHWAVFVP